MAIKRPQSDQSGVPADAACVDPSWQERWPTLCSYLFDLRYEDGTPRQTSTLMLLAEQGVAKACLNDREAERSAWVSGRALSEVLDALEVGLANDRLDWRARPPGRSPGKQRK